MKTCSRCLNERSRDQFAKGKQFTDGLQVWCKPCMKDYRAGRRLRACLLERQSRYGVSPDVQMTMMARQHSECAACSDPLNLLSAHLDHNHTTGAVRQFLCAPCNLTLGHSRESIDRLIGLVRYLEKVA